MAEIENKYARFYVAINPNPARGPSTWRTASPDTIGGAGGGGTGGGNYDFDGVAPINVSTTPIPGGPTQVETSMDIQQLDDRAT